MHITIERSQLLTVLKRTGAAIVNGDSMPYKSSVLITASESDITLRSTSDALYVVCLALGSVKKPGRALLNHHRLSSIVNELPPGMVEITVNDKLQTVVKASTSKRKFTMQSHVPDIYPPVLEEGPGVLLYTVESKILQQNAAEVMFGIDKSRTDGALLAPFDGKRFRLMTVSGWSFCAATGWFVENESGSSTEEVLLPRILLSAASVLPADNTQVGIYTSSSRVTLVTTETTIGCGQLQMGFPNIWQHWLDAIPKDKRFKVSSEAYLASVKAVSVAADVVEGDERFVQIDTAYRNGECLVSTRQSEKNYGEDELPVTEPSETACRVAMDGMRLSQALRAFAPYEIDVYYDAVNGQETLILRNENLLAALLPINIIHAKGAP
jgi:DNA polymerase III sliding clamp (beta) subunit (PCNA family)